MTICLLSRIVCPIGAVRNMAAMHSLNDRLRWA